MSGMKFLTIQLVIFGFAEELLHSPFCCINRLDGLQLIFAEVVRAPVFHHVTSKSDRCFDVQDSNCNIFFIICLRPCVEFSITDIHVVEF
jgi:hypothetical protein